MHSYQSPPMRGLLNRQDTQNRLKMVLRQFTVRMNSKKYKILMIWLSTSAVKYTGSVPIVQKKFSRNCAESLFICLNLSSGAKQRKLSPLVASLANVSVLVIFIVFIMIYVSKTSILRLIALVLSVKICKKALPSSYMLNKW